MNFVIRKSFQGHTEDGFLLNRWYYKTEKYAAGRPWYEEVYEAQYFANILRCVYSYED